MQETQPAEWAKFKKWHNGQSEAMFVKRVAKQLDTHGTLHVLRHGFKVVDAKFRLCQFRPAHGKNPALMEAYKRNRLTLVRQLHYSLHNENSIDLVLFVNGLLQLIELQGKVLECDADGQAHEAFHDLMHSLAAEQEGWPAYDRSKAKESAAKWAAKGKPGQSDVRTNIQINWQLDVRRQ